MSDILGKSDQPKSSTGTSDVKLSEEQLAQGVSTKQEQASQTQTETEQSVLDQFEQASKLLRGIKQEIHKVFIGQENVVEQVLVALLAQGHILIEGVPGLGKTLLVRALSACFGGEFSRVQFTPDLMPSDVTGHAMFNSAKQEFEIRKGPAFTNLLLADEINRAPAKTQSALLEVMQEGQITIEGESFSTLQPFMVLATQNPLEQEGTYPLPEAELDRFMLKVLMNYPEESEELDMLRMMGGQKNIGFNVKHIRALLKDTHVISLQKITQNITVDDVILAYMTRLVRATRSWSGIERGAGPRASIALLSASRALALLRENTFVTPDDVKEIFVAALRHRILLSAELEIEGISPDKILMDILYNVEAPRA